jgi:glycine/D-amino acid oxidase-like deaminating enzyme
MPGRTNCDVAVIGGGLVGAAIAWGLARAGQRVAVFDEGDIAYRASRGNFALVWVQSKGLGMPEYAAWTRRSSDSWAEFARLLEDDTGVDVTFERPGGFHLCLSETELAAHAAMLTRLHNQPRMVNYPYSIMERGELEKVLPLIGPEVVGGSYCPLDGHCNSLRLLRALHTGLKRRGATYLPNHRVDRIEPRSGAFRIVTEAGEADAAKVVLAAGNGNARLSAMVGLRVLVRPQRGQIVVTERVRPFLSYPIATIRQTDEGSVMLGDSVEESGWNEDVGIAVLATIANRATRMFPLLRRLRVVRSWAALRVMTQDGFPIYDESPVHPGAFAAAGHSGVTLAANHALELAPMIAAGRLHSDLTIFSARRFYVPKAASA